MWRPGFILAVCAALAAPAAVAGDCTLVFGQGRGAADPDVDAARRWDRVNRRFNAEVAAQLQAAGRRVVALVLPLAARDVPANVQRLLVRAQAEGCTRIVETTLFADEAAKTLVARLREYPVVGDAGAALDAPALRIGAPSYADERVFELTQATLERVRPALLADAMAAELLARR